MKLTGTMKLGGVETAFTMEDYGWQMHDATDALMLAREPLLDALHEAFQKWHEEHVCERCHDAITDGAEDTETFKKCVDCLWAEDAEFNREYGE